MGETVFLRRLSDCNADVIESLSNALIVIHEATQTATLTYYTERTLETTKRMGGLRKALITGYLETSAFRAPLQRDSGRQKRAMCSSL